jgi:hypothetical protein
MLELLTYLFIKPSFPLETIISTGIPPSFSPQTPLYLPRYQAQKLSLARASFFLSFDIQLSALVFTTIVYVG